MFDANNISSRSYVRHIRIQTPGVLPDKLGGDVRSASQNPYPIYDQNLQYSLPYL